MSDKENAKGANSDMMTTIYRAAVVILLAGILIVQWQILSSMNTSASGGTPTLGDLRNTEDAEARQALMDNVPLVRIQGGNVTVNGAVSLNRQNANQQRPNQNQ